MPVKIRYIITIDEDEEPIEKKAGIPDEPPAGGDTPPASAPAQEPTPTAKTAPAPAPAAPVAPVGDDSGEDSAWAQIEKHAETIQKAAPTMTWAEAVDKACEQHPDLVHEYENGR